jgi:hypothetical protein
VSHPLIPVLAERGGIQLKTPRPVLLVDTREQNPFDFSRFAGWFAIGKQLFAIHAVGSSHSSFSTDL